LVVVLLPVVPVVPVVPASVPEEPLSEVPVPDAELVAAAGLAEPEGLGVELVFAEPELEPQADSTMSALTGNRRLMRMIRIPCLAVTPHDQNDSAKIGLGREHCQPFRQMRAV
jgi:hypothetical protein